MCVCVCFVRTRGIKKRLELTGHHTEACRDACGPGAGVRGVGTALALQSGAPRVNTSTGEYKHHSTALATGCVVHTAHCPLGNRKINWAHAHWAAAAAAMPPHVGRASRPDRTPPPIKSNQPVGRATAHTEQEAVKLGQLVGGDDGIIGLRGSAHLGQHLSGQRLRDLREVGDKGWRWG